MDREDAEAVPWMAGFTRDPFPEIIVWKQSSTTHTRFTGLPSRPPTPREARKSTRRSMGKR